MEIKKALVLFGLLGVFAGSFGAESSAGVQHVRQPPRKLSLKDTGAGVIDEDPQAALEKKPVELKKSSTDGPLNVILLLVDGLYRSDVTAFLDNKDAFPVHGLLQTCPSDDIHHSGASNCNCDEKLGSSVASLLSWAQSDKGMSTTTLYEMPNGISGPRARLIDRQRRKAPWALQIEPVVKNEGANTDIFFRSLMSDLSVTQSRKPSIVQQSNVAELTSDVLKELSLMPNEHGHLAIMRTGVDGLGNVLELFKRYVSPSNTLTVVMNSCPQDHSNLVPFFAGGLGSKQLFSIDLKRLHDLPAAIRDIIDGQHEIVGAKNVMPIKIFMSDESMDLEDHDRYNRQATDAPAAAVPKQETTTVAPNSQEAITQSTMMIITFATATITYALKF